MSPWPRGPACFEPDRLGRKQASRLAFGLQSDRLRRVGALVDNERWTRSRAGTVLHADSDDHVALVARTLGVSEAVWGNVVDRYVEQPVELLSTEQKLSALATAFGEVAPLAAPLPASGPVACVVCDEHAVRPAVARRTGGEALIYGRCAACGHGRLLVGASTDVYGSGTYYERRAADGSGYGHYAAEREYREAKGHRLISRLLESGPAGSLLEVGSGYGFTMHAARERGLRVCGVDVNPAAAREARALYGLETVTSSLQQALESGAVPPGRHDIVLYQFVLEHVAEPRRELQQAARALTPGGRLVLIVPSMSTFELAVFGASYRSLRGDHLHLFSRPSLARLFADAGLLLLELTSHCSLHLLRGFLSSTELEALYAAGLGPDLTVIAGKPS